MGDGRGEGMGEGRDGGVGEGGLRDRRGIGEGRGGGIGERREGRRKAMSYTDQHMVVYMLGDMDTILGSGRLHPMVSSMEFLQINHTWHNHTI